MLMASEDEMNAGKPASEADAPPEVDPEVPATQPPLVDEMEDDHGVPASQALSANEANNSQGVGSSYEQEGLLSTQAEAPDYLDAVDALEVAAETEYEVLTAKVKNSTDPSQDAQDRLRDLAKQAWKMAFKEDITDLSQLAGKVEGLQPQQAESFHNAWGKLVYDVKEVYQAIGFQRKPEATGLRSFITSHCQGFFADLLSDKKPNPEKAQADTSLRSLCPAVIADAATRISLGNGLPRDGHVIFSAFQGQCAFYWNGPAGTLANPPLKGTESEWNVASTTLPLIVAGESAAGKDNVKRVVLDWLGKLADDQKPATRALLQGHCSASVCGFEAFQSFPYHSIQTYLNK